ncbi:hypothetical protein ACEQ8H_005951 [Pleosporales sp. CAS-2024a]
MDSSSAIAIGIAILVILTIQMLVLSALATHLFLRNSSRHAADEDKLHARRQLALHERNISRPFALTRLGPNLHETLHQPAAVAVDEANEIHGNLAPSRPSDSLYASMASAPPRPRNPTPDSAAAAAAARRDSKGTSRASSVYSQAPWGQHAGQQMPLQVETRRMEEESSARKKPLSGSNHYPPQ